MWRRRRQRRTTASSARRPDRGYLSTGRTTAARPGLVALKRRLSDIVHRRIVADAKAVKTGPGGHVGATLQSSAANLNPMVDTSEKSLSGPAEPRHRTPLLTAS